MTTKLISSVLLTGLLASVGEHYPLVTVSCERTEPDVCYVGRVTEVQDHHFTLHELSTEAEWLDERRYRAADVSRLDFDGGYERALALVAGLLRE